MNYRPGNLVGGIQNAVTGFVSGITNRPSRYLRRLNREFNSFLRPIYRWF